MNLAENQRSITTRYFPATAVYAPRIRARAVTGETVTVWHSTHDSGRGQAAPHPMDRESHLRAATALRTRMGWTNHFLGAPSPAGNGYLFVATASDLML